MSLPASLRRAESFKTPRNIAAPFQSKNEIPSSPHSPNGKFGDKDEARFEFTPLDDLSKLTFEKYCGPTPESNWVIPNHLLVGAYPASQDDAETFELITSILKLGVTKFVCLQQEYRSHGVTEAMWRSGQALRPYFEDVRLVVRLKESIPELNGFQIVDEDKLDFVHFPIKDCGITDDARVLELARSLVKALSENEVIYLHCWGGHGRTGTLVCIMLHLMYGLTPVESMARCQFVHDLRQCPVNVGSPQTQPQRDQVTRIINRLMTQTRFLRRTISDVSLSEPPSAPSPSRSPRSGPPTPVTRKKSLSITGSTEHDDYVNSHPTHSESAKDKTLNMFEPIEHHNSANMLKKSNSSSDNNSNWNNSPSKKQNSFNNDHPQPGTVNQLKSQFERKSWQPNASPRSSSSQSNSSKDQSMATTSSVIRQQVQNNKGEPMDSEIDSEKMNVDTALPYESPKPPQSAHPSSSMSSSIIGALRNFRVGAKGTS